MVSSCCINPFWAVPSFEYPALIYTLLRCVSGTPVKKDARDLFGLVDFLHYKPYCDFPSHVWERLVTQHKNVFRRIFGTIALRHTKNQIRDEIQLPPQRRVVITVPFTQIEEQHYVTMFGLMAEDCGLNLDGTPKTHDWDPDSPTTIERMRNWLTRLRQTCLHPEVGARNRRALGGKGPLRTVGEVLEVMIDQNDVATRLEERTVRWCDTFVLRTASKAVYLFLAYDGFSSRSCSFEIELVY